MHFQTFRFWIHARVLRQGSERRRTDGQTDRFSRFRTTECSGAFRFLAAMPQASLAPPSGRRNVTSHRLLPLSYASASRTSRPPTPSASESSLSAQICSHHRKRTACTSGFMRRSSLFGAFLSTPSSSPSMRSKKFTQPSALWHRCEKLRRVG